MRNSREIETFGDLIGEGVKMIQKMSEMKDSTKLPEGGLKDEVESNNESGDYDNDVGEILGWESESMKSNESSNESSFESKLHEIGRIFSLSNENGMYKFDDYDDLIVTMEGCKEVRGDPLKAPHFETLNEIINEKIDELKVRLDMNVIFPLKVFIERFKEGKYDFAIGMMLILLVAMFILAFALHESISGAWD